MEIERKWLADGKALPFRPESFPHTDIVQNYLSFSPTLRIRMLDGGKSCILTMKSASGADGLEREEYEIPITKEQYFRLLPKTEGRSIEKTRYRIPDGDGVLELDIFRGELSGLVLLEREFTSREEALSYVPPAWAGREVTREKTYRNAFLAQLSDLSKALPS